MKFSSLPEVNRGHQQSAQCLIRPDSFTIDKLVLGASLSACTLYERAMPTMSSDVRCCTAGEPLTVCGSTVLQTVIMMVIIVIKIIIITIMMIIMKHLLSANL